MDKKGPQSRRRIYFIERSFQAKFMLKYCLIVFFGGLLTVGITYLLALQSTSVLIENSRVVARNTADFILPILLQTVAIVMAFVILATVAVTLFVSHKIAGPLYRFKKVMQSLGEGDYHSDFHIRELDQLQGFADAFNEMILKMRSQINMIKEASSAVQKKLDALSEGDISEQKKQYMRELKNIFAELNRTLSRLKS